MVQQLAIMYKENNIRYVLHKNLWVNEYIAGGRLIYLNFICDVVNFV